MAVTFEALVNAFVFALTAYALSGCLFSLVFVVFGITKVDSAATGSSVFFRLLIIPGAIAFWPLLLRRWRKATLRKATHP